MTAALIILAFAFGLYLGITIMACMVMAKRADASSGISLPTVGSHATNPFQDRDVADDN